MELGMIGLGRMGAYMTKRLLAAGHTVIAFDQDRAAVARSAADGAIGADSLEALVEKRYLRNIPVDPMSESAATWQITPPAEENKGKVFDVKSGAEGRAADGTSYKEW